MNKQLKILENKVKQLENEVTELSANCADRLKSLALNDGLYQNLQGQILEKRKSLNLVSEFIAMLGNKDDRGTVTEDQKPEAPTKRKRGPSKKVTGKDKSAGATPDIQTE